MLRRIATIALSTIVALSTLLHSSTPTTSAIDISETNPPQVIWEVVADPDHQERVSLNGWGRDGSKWQGGYLISSRDGKAVTFRYQIGSGSHRIEYDNKRVEYVEWVSTCTEGPAERLPGDPRAENAELRFIECDEPNQFVIETNQAWWFPPGTARKV